MSTWFTADTHFGHENIIAFCSRPHRNGREMNEALIELWNERVQNDDLVIHAGDFGSPRCKDPRPYLERLNGTIILIAGNHDGSKMRRLMPYWTTRMEMRIGDFNCLINHRPSYPKDMQGANDKFQDHDDTIMNPEKYHFILSGHIHEKRLWTHRSLNIGVDKHDFAPLSEAELHWYLEERTKEFNNNRSKVRVCV